MSPNLSHNQVADMKWSPGYHTPGGSCNLIVDRLRPPQEVSEAHLHQASKSCFVAA